MPSTYSTNLKIELMAPGENSGTWGGVTNTNLGTALEQAIVGYGNPDFGSDANLTISLTNSNAAQAARALVLNVTSTGSLTATRDLVVPTIEKQYMVQNNTSGGQSIVVKTSAGTGITIPNGRKAHLYVDGTNVIQMFDFVDINGGSIDGTPVGASSASTGAFTTLTSSSTTTLNGTSIPASATLLDTGDIGVSVQGYDAELTVWAGKTAPTGDVIGTTDTQTLTNKTLSVDSNTVDGIAASSFVLSNGSGAIDGSAAQKAIPSGDVVGTSDAQTLSSKRIDPRVYSTTSASSITPDVSLYDQICFTALAATLTINAPTGTPVDGTKLLFRIKDNAVARSLSWNATYTPIGMILPTATVANKTLYVGCVYNASLTRWDVISYILQY